MVVTTMHYTNWRVIYFTLHWNQFKVNPLACTLRTRILPKFLATSDVRYWINHVCRCAAWLIDVEEKQT